MSDHATPGMTITCSEIVEVVTDYLEGEVDEAVRVEVEAHLALCPGCDAYLAQMRATLQVLGHVPVESLSEVARDDLLAAFHTFRPPAAGSP
jgi:anti-sigma factor RsiW